MKTTTGPPSVRSHTWPAGHTVVVGFVLTLPFGLAAVGPLDLVQVAALGLVLGTAALHTAFDAGREAMSRVAALGAVLIVAAALSTPFSEESDATFRADIQLVIGVAVAMSIAVVCTDRRALERLLWALLLVGTLVATYAIATVGRQESVLGGGVVQGRATGVFGQPNELGAFLAALVVLALGGLAWAPSRAGRRLAVLATVVMSVALLLSLSRGAWMGAALGALVLVVAVPRLRGPVGGLLGGVAVLGVIVATVVNLPELTVIRTRLASLGNPSDNPYDNRAAIYHEAVRQIESKPVLGHGPGSFPAVAAQTSSGKQGLEAEHAHNLLLTAAAEYGLVGAMALLLVAGCLAFWAWGAVRGLLRAGQLHEAAACAALAGALATLVGHGLVDYPLRNSLMYLTCWVLLGALVAATLASRRESVR